MLKTGKKANLLHRTKKNAKDYVVVYVCFSVRLFIGTEMTAFGSTFIRG